jgi:deoxyribodipyrimidine photo-lyase
MSDPVIVWFRQDLRLHDQAALIAAAGEGPVIPVYVLDDETPVDDRRGGDRRMGGAQRWWLHHSLASLDRSLRDRGSRLILRRGAAGAVLTALKEETGAQRIHAIRHYEPWWRAVEAELGEAIVLHDGTHLARIEEVRAGSGGLFRIYSAFWKGLQAFVPPAEPASVPEFASPARWPESDALGDWQLLPDKLSWAAGFDHDWTPGEAAGRDKLEDLGRIVDDYERERNLPAEEGTSRLSPHLHFGEVSPAAVWHASAGRTDSVKFHKELAWRDFTAGVILQTPDYGDRNGRAKYDRLAWRTGEEAEADLRAWQRGRTGYPIVDAGMRQLWTSGWMHNRVRMIAASFLVKHLLLDWRWGERWYWDCLVDADYGNNSVNWQWIAGTGIDANMFGRIMAPLGQSEKFDAGDYIRHWVPELAGLPADAIHDPDEAGLRPAGYPAKIIGHREARARALAANAAL